MPGLNECAEAHLQGCQSAPYWGSSCLDAPRARLAPQCGAVPTAIWHRRAWSTFQQDEHSPFQVSS